ncbi:MAG TPA: site-2 protease family protein [Candidatus Kaiserbacteria bacterium]|nr:site-2 protease family protein [Candidatus Kaiserbacteria bacterium]
MPHIDLIGSILIPAFLVFTHAGILFGWAKPVPYNPYNLKNQRWGEAMVAFAGPATNLAIAILFAFVVRAAGAGILPAAAGAFAVIIVFVNLFLGLFNLIPIPPFDGYTFLSSVLPYKHTMKMRSIEQHIMAMGPMGLILVLFLFIFLFSTPFYNFVVYLFRLLVGV